MKRDLALMTVILLLAFVIGAANLNADPVWLDELASLTLFGVFDPYFNPSDVLLAMSRYSPADVPIFPIMGAWWARLVGISQFALRAMPLLLGMLSLAMAYRFARDVFNRRTGFVAAFLLASNSFALIYFHELRNYTHFMVMSTLYVWVYLRLTNRARERRRLRLCFPLLSVLFIYTHAYGGILIAALALHHAFLKPKDRRWLEVWLSWALAAIAMLPFALAMVEGVALVTNDGYADPLPEVFGALLHLLVNGADWLWLIVLPLIVYAWRRTRNQNLRLVIALAGTAIALLLLAHLQFALITTTRIRHFLFVWFLLMSALAYALTSLPRWKPITAVFCVLWLVAGAQFGVTRDLGSHYVGSPAHLGRLPPLQDYVAGLRGKVSAPDFLLGFYIVYDVNFLWDVHSAGSVLDYYTDAQLGIDGLFLHGSKRQYRLDRDVRDVMRAHPHIVLAHDPSEVPINYAHVKSMIEAEYAPCPILVDQPGLHALKYTQPLMACDHAPAPVEYDNGMRLIDRATVYDADKARVQSLLWWDLPADVTLDAYNISLQLFDAAGEKALQVDRHLDANLVPWGVVDMPLDDLPAGAYELMLILYARDGGTKVAGADLQTGESAKFISLAQLEITDP